jgi:sugar lactone lactonase YvrE
MSVSIDYTGGVFKANKAKSVGTVTAGTGPYNLASASYDNVSFSVATEETGPKGIAFKPDGTRMFLTGSGTDKVYQYDLSTAWDVSTASYNNVSAGIFTGGFNPWGINFKPDGTMMFLCGVASNVIQRIDLSTAWDLSTAGNPSDRSLTGITSFPSGIVLKPDGTRFIIVSRSDDTLYQFDCGTAWQTESSTYNNVSFSVTNQATQPEGVEVNSDGTKLFVSCSNTDTVYQYSLSTAWDLSTASYDNVSFSLASQDGTPSGVKFKPDGLKMYMVGDVNNTVYQYSTGTATTLDLSTGNYFSHTPSVNTVFAFSNPPASGTAAGFALALTGGNAAETYDIANASYDNVSFSVLVLVWLLKKQLLLVCSLNLTELKCILLAGPHPLL